MPGRFRRHRCPREIRARNIDSQTCPQPLRLPTRLNLRSRRARAGRIFPAENWSRKSLPSWSKYLLRIRFRILREAELKFARPPSLLHSRFLPQFQEDSMKSLSKKPQNHSKKTKQPHRRQRQSIIIFERFFGESFFSL